MSRETDLAYLAGVIDSDGCIMVQRAPWNGRNRASVSYSAIVTIAQVETEACELARTVLGGFVLWPRPKNVRARPMIRWTVKSQKAGKALRAVRPYLRIKASQADNAIHLCDLITQSRSDRCKGRVRCGARPRTDAETAAMHECYLKSRALNAVGAHLLIEQRTRGTLGLELSA